MSLLVIGGIIGCIFLVCNKNDNKKSNDDLKVIKLDKETVIKGKEECIIEKSDIHFKVTENVKWAIPDAPRRCNCKF